jgi:6,7-dimethyl-8-ribityllumazine synthase
LNRDIDESSENVLSDWSRRAAGDEVPPTDDPSAFEVDDDPMLAAERESSEVVEDEVEDELAPESAAAVEATDELEHQYPIVGTDDEEPASEFEDPDASPPMIVAPTPEHAIGELEIPDGYAVLEGDSDGSRRAVGVVVARFNGAVTSRLLEQALGELDTAGVPREAITIMVVPGAFELPLAATALAKTRRFACIVALGCVIRGDTPHFDYVAGEAASGLQLAALETGVPVSFGLLTLDRVEQADARIEKGAEAVRTALEMADLFSHLRAAASR